MKTKLKLSTCLKIGTALCGTIGTILAACAVPFTAPIALLAVAGFCGILAEYFDAQEKDADAKEQADMVKHVADDAAQHAEEKMHQDIHQEFSLLFHKLDKQNGVADTVDAKIFDIDEDLYPVIALQMPAPNALLVPADAVPDNNPNYAQNELNIGKVTITGCIYEAENEMAGYGA